MHAVVKKPIFNMTKLQEKHCKAMMAWFTQNPEVKDVFETGWDCCPLNQYVADRIDGEPDIIARIAKDLDHPDAEAWLKEYEV